MKSYKSLVFPYLTWMTIFVMLPMLLITLYAFTQSGNAVISLEFTFANFKKFLDPVFLKVLYNSLKIAAITTVICLIIGYPLAYIISKQTDRMQTLLILLVTIPMWINMMVRTYAWISILSDVGIINNFLGIFGLGPVKMMYTDFAVIVGMVYNFLPFMIIQIYTVLAKMDHSIIDASYDLGANRFETFTKVIFPLSLSGVISGITLVFLPAISTFVIPQFLGGGSYVLIGNLIETQFISVGDYHFGSAISLILALLMMLSLHFANKFEERESSINKKRRIA
ncbi:ABC transporter permease [Erysipelothrix urinaevulpis]|uniref:ABC transporter permease n=1 Tax=Erysipelothrix urinaevulpis TaxID=2683717 RepID=UPI001357558A|nr:ABC transporter permease [Erysipelothrix urinaevulpis]